MKKFKIKNRQKRKYTKKINTQISVPLSHSLALSSLPFLILAFGLISSFVLLSLPYQQVQQPFLELTQQMTLPAITLPTLPALPSLPVLPTIPIPSPQKLNLPTITVNFAPLQSLINGLGIIITASSLFIINAVNASINIILSQVQLITATQITLTIHYYLLILSVLSKSLQVLFTTTISGVLTINQLIITSVGLLEQATWVFLINFLFVSHVFITTTLIILQQVIGVISDTITTIIYYLELPFKILGIYIEKSKPYFVIFGQLVENAANQFTQGVDNLASITSSIAKLSQK